MRLVCVCGGGISFCILCGEVDERGVGRVVGGSHGGIRNKYSYLGMGLYRHGAKGECILPPELHTHTHTVSLLNKAYTGDGGRLNQSPM